MLSEWPTEDCLDFSTWRNYKSVRAWVQVMVLFPHVFLQAYSVANVTQLKARGSWRIMINHLFSVRWKTSKLTDSIPAERGELAKDDLHKQDHQHFSLSDISPPHSSQGLTDDIESEGHSRRQSCCIVNSRYFLARGWIIQDWESCQTQMYWVG